jgi:hypothetical protein
MSARRNTQNAKRGRASDAVTEPSLKQLKRSLSVESAGSDGWPSPVFQPALELEPVPAPAVLDLSASDSDSDEPEPKPEPESELLSKKEAEAARSEASRLCDWAELMVHKRRNILATCQLNPYTQDASKKMTRRMELLAKRFEDWVDILPRQTSVSDVTAYSTKTPEQIGAMPKWEQLLAEASMLFDKHYQALAGELVKLRLQELKYLPEARRRNVPCA